MITLNVIGLDETIKRFDTLPKEVQTMVSASLEEGARLWVRNAQRDAPVRKTAITAAKVNPASLIGGGTYGGNLKQMITYEGARGGLTFTVISGAFYSPYIEWGTITKVKVPSELSNYAITFKGRGIRRTGGIYPVPFFFRQQEAVTVQIENDLKKINDIKI